MGAGSEDELRLWILGADCESQSLHEYDHWCQVLPGSFELTDPPEHMRSRTLLSAADLFRQFGAKKLVLEKSSVGGR